MPNLTLQLYDFRPTADGIARASVIRGFPAERISKVEGVWSPIRRNLSLEHSHWSWVNIYRPDEHCLVAVECLGDVQGLVAVATQFRPSILRLGEQVVYIDFIETAPWNVKTSDRPPRFTRAGSLLIWEAIWISLRQGAEGRIGLHSLPQSETYYRNFGFCDLGTDPDYYDLRYFEYPVYSLRKM